MLEKLIRFFGFLISTNELLMSKINSFGFQKLNNIDFKKQRPDLTKNRIRRSHATPTQNLTSAENQHNNQVFVLHFVHPVGWLQEISHVRHQTSARHCTWGVNIAWWDFVSNTHVATLTSVRSAELNLVTTAANAVCTRLLFPNATFTNFIPAKTSHFSV